MPPPRIQAALTADDFVKARALIAEYSRELGVDLCFQDVAVELANLSTMYGPPGGSLFLASLDSHDIGCIGIRRVSDSTCEMKRLYIRPAHRGAGIGRLLAESAIRMAETLGYRRIVLDTLPSMDTAIGLYRSMGFRETDPYYPNPLPGVIYMELKLGEHAS